MQAFKWHLHVCVWMPACESAYLCCLCVGIVLEHGGHCIPDVVYSVQGDSLLPTSVVYLYSLTRVRLTQWTKPVPTRSNPFDHTSIKTPKHEAIAPAWRKTQIHSQCKHQLLWHALLWKLFLFILIVHTPVIHCWCLCPDEHCWVLISINMGGSPPLFRLCLTIYSCTSSGLMRNGFPTPQLQEGLVDSLRNLKSR